MKTNIQGYYNGNDWPVQIHLSDPNFHMTVEKGKFILDNQGRKVNDPKLERFVVKNGLSREVVAAHLDVTALPSPGVSVVSIEARAKSSPVLQATGFTRNAQGETVPVFAPTTAKPTPLPQGSSETMPVNQPGSPVRAFTMDEAHRLGLVGRIKPLPEDFGAPDSGTGAPAPANHIPEMRLPMEAARPKPQPLPVELTQLDEKKLTPEQIAAARSLQSSLSQAASASPDRMQFKPTTAAAVSTPEVPPITEAEAQALPAPIKPVVRRVGSPLHKLMSKPLPEPNLEGIMPQPAAEALTSAPTSVARVTSKTTICPLCQAGPFSNIGTARRHGNKRHPDQVALVIAGWL